jgi:gas vesicle protein
MNHSEKTFFAFLIGVAAGVTAGFLFAPAKGEKTRRKLTSKANEFTGELKENIDREKLKGLANSAFSEVEKYGQKLTGVLKN